MIVLYIITFLFARNTYAFVYLLLIPKYFLYFYEVLYDFQGIMEVLTTHTHTHMHDYS